MFRFIKEYWLGFLLGTIFLTALTSLGIYDVNHPPIPSVIQGKISSISMVSEDSKSSYQGVIMTFADGRVIRLRVYQTSGYVFQIGQDVRIEYNSDMTIKSIGPSK